MKSHIFAMAALAAAQFAWGQAAWAQAGNQDSAFQICQRAGIPVGSAAMTDCISRLSADARPDRGRPGALPDGFSEQQADLPETLGDDIHRRSGPAEAPPHEQAAPGEAATAPAQPRDLPAAPNATPPQELDGREQR